jgi:Toxin PAAR-like domain
MGCEVFANGDEIACKAGDGKVIASFPDVCLTPPPPPAGPIPVPYPDTSFSRDMKDGSKTVMIMGKEVMLKDQSYYKTSPLGDEAATNGQGANVITHVITGKTYFITWSMDVKFDGENVDRHTDMTTSNHASRPAGAVTPNSNNAALGRVTWENQTCRDEVLEGLRTRKEKIEDDLKACHKASPPGMGSAGGAARRRALACFRLQCTMRHQKRLLAIREEKRDKCFNDPALDNTPGNPKVTNELQTERVNHDTQIAELRAGMYGPNGTRAQAREACGPG